MSNKALLSGDLRGFGLRIDLAYFPLVGDDIDTGLMVPQLIIRLLKGISRTDLELFSLHARLAALARCFTDHIELTPPGQKFQDEPLLPRFAIYNGTGLIMSDRKSDRREVPLMHVRHVLFLRSGNTLLSTLFSTITGTNIDVDMGYAISYAIASELYITPGIPISARFDIEHEFVTRAVTNVELSLHKETPDVRALVGQAMKKVRSDMGSGRIRAEDVRATFTLRIALFPEMITRGHNVAQGDLVYGDAVEHALLVGLRGDRDSEAHVHHERTVDAALRACKKSFEDEIASFGLRPDSLAISSLRKAFHDELKKLFGLHDRTTGPNVNVQDSAGAAHVISRRRSYMQNLQDTVDSVLTKFRAAAQSKTVRETDWSSQLPSRAVFIAARIANTDNGLNHTVAVSLATMRLADLAQIPGAAAAMYNNADIIGQSDYVTRRELEEHLTKKRRETFFQLNSNEKSCLYCLGRLTENGGDRWVGRARVFIRGPVGQRGLGSCQCRLGRLFNYAGGGRIRRSVLTTSMGW
ncbi:hypothetical protein B0T20DRAFT_393092 [Sordaria brevicollis]|uniref:Uncharacterized protein n=1 Tax=Sordaria brevicollis TaxID=83679 RepID=A0AAE0PF98_SORBR|nr:hypothetical protein B0T20DRAFT_393092 [Sordaria brevicollis]